MANNFYTDSVKLILNFVILIFIHQRKWQHIAIMYVCIKRFLHCQCKLYIVYYKYRRIKVSTRDIEEGWRQDESSSKSQKRRVQYLSWRIVSENGGCCYCRRDAGAFHGGCCSEFSSAEIVTKSKSLDLIGKWKMDWIIVARILFCCSMLWIVITRLVKKDMNILYSNAFGGFLLHWSTSLFLFQRWSTSLI